MRVAFCGASGTGKTTLAEFVKDTYKLPMNPVGSRSVAHAMGFASPYDVDKSGHRAEFQTLLLNSKAAWERDEEAFVTDRTVADNLAYTMLHDVDCVTSEMIAKAKSAFQRYTHVVYCPFAAFWKHGGDAMRKEDPAYHMTFDLLLRGLLKEFESESQEFIALAYSKTLEERRDALEVFFNNRPGRDAR